MASDSAMKSVGQAGVIKIYNGKLSEGDIATIYKGSFGKEKKVAVKDTDEDQNPDISALCQLDHENIARIYFAYIEGHQIENNRRIEILRQITDGLDYLHSGRTFYTVHRNLNPTNILLHYADRGNNWTVKISGFGQCINVYNGNNPPQREVSGRIQEFMAPELSSKAGVPKSCGKEVDIFALGKIFDYVLIESKVPSGNVAEQAEIGSQEKYDDLISAMIHKKSEKRISVKDVKQHYIFWSASKKAIFFVRVSNYTSDKSKQQELKNKLDSGSVLKLADGKWRSKIFPSRTDSDTGSSCENPSCNSKHEREENNLLSFIRNASQHYFNRDTCLTLREKMGKYPEEFVKYFTSLFPELLPHIYDVMKCKKGIPIFREFYHVSEAEKCPDDDIKPETNEPTKPPQSRIVVFGQTKDGVYYCDPIKDDVQIGDWKTKQLPKKSIQGTTKFFGFKDTFTAVSIGSRLYVIRWDGQIFFADLAEDKPYWSRFQEKKAKPHGEHPPAAVIGDCIYLCGGGWPKQCINVNLKGEKQEKASKECEIISTTDCSLEELPDMVHACRLNAVVAVGDKLYTIGGVDEKDNVLQHMEMYDTKDEVLGWNIISRRLSLPRCEASAVALNEKIYILGGERKREDSQKAPTIVVEEYDTEKSSLTTISDMKVPRSRLTACVQDGKIYAVGFISRLKVSSVKKASLEVLHNGEWHLRDLDNHHEADCVAMEF